MKIRRIVGRSMEPTFYDGEIVVFRRSKSYVVGDVVIATVEGREVVKRVSGTTANKVYLLGDNAPSSTDSRQYGAISNDAIIGKVVYKLPFIVRQK